MEAGQSDRSVLAGATTRRVTHGASVGTLASCSLLLRHRPTHSAPLRYGVHGAAFLVAPSAKACTSSAGTWTSRSFDRSGSGCSHGSLVTVIRAILANPRGHSATEPARSPNGGGARRRPWPGSGNAPSSSAGCVLVVSTNARPQFAAAHRCTRSSCPAANSCANASAQIAVHASNHVGALTVGVQRPAAVLLGEVRDGRRGAQQLVEPIGRRVDPFAVQRDDDRVQRTGEAEESGTVFGRATVHASPATTRSLTRPSATGIPELFDIPVQRHLTRDSSARSVVPA